VFVNDGDSNLASVSLQAVNDDGESQAAVVRVFCQKIPRLPSARFLSPEATDTVGRPEYPITFRVESERPLERVEISRGGEVLYRAGLNKVEREGPRYVLQEKAALTLQSGVNVLDLVAVNSDGRSPRAKVEVTYNPPAVLVNIDEVQLVAADGTRQEVLKPVYRSGDLIFPTAAPRSLVWLVGQVRWSDPMAKALDDLSLELVAKVDDCRQFPVALEPRGKGNQANVRPFRVPLVLIGTKNRINIEVFGEQELGRREFELDCIAPVKNQRLHLLIAGVNVKDGAQLKKRVLEALGVDPKDQPAGSRGEFSKKPPFERCYLYQVLVGDVDRLKVEAQLVAINNGIAQLVRETHWLNDVVLIYYQGEDVEVPGKKERWLKTTRNLQFPNESLEKFAIPCHALQRVPGVKLLLLNVVGAQGALSTGADLGGHPDTGLLRYARLDRTETADPALLGVLQEATGKKSRLGEIVEYINDQHCQQPKKFGELFVVLDPHQNSRQIAEPKDRILSLKKAVANQKEVSAQSVAAYQPKSAARIDDLHISAADLLRQLPGVVQVEVSVTAEKPTRRIVHLRDLHFVPKDLYAIDLKNAAGRELSDQEIDRLHQELLLEVEAVQLEQMALLRCLIKHHGLRRIYSEGLTTKDLPNYKEKVAVYRDVENNQIGQLRKQLVDVHELLIRTEPKTDRFQLAKKIEAKVIELIDQHRLRLLEIGAAGRLLIAGEIDEVLPLDDADLLEEARPNTLEGQLKMDPAKLTARHDAQVKAVLGNGAFGLIVLGGPHDLSDSVRHLGQNSCEYIRVTTRRFLKFSE
jgi:hypothetical protein